MAGMAESPEVGGKDRDRKKPTEKNRGPLTRDNDNPREESDPRKTGIGMLDAVDDFLQQKQTPGDPNIPTERSVDGFDPQTPEARRHHRNPNDDQRPARPVLKPPEEEPIIPGDPSNLGARGRRRGARDDVNASPVLRRGLLGV